MRIHSNVLTIADIESALAQCKSDGTIHDAVRIDVAEVKASRKRTGAIELRIGAPSGTPTFYAQRTVDYLAYVLGETADAVMGVAKRSGRRFSRQGYAGDYMSGNTLRMGATWHEWGYLIEKLFEKDFNAIIGNYDGIDSFEYQTGYDNIPPFVFRDKEWALKDWNGRAMEWC